MKEKRDTHTPLTNKPHLEMRSVGSSSFFIVPGHRPSAISMVQGECQPEFCSSSPGSTAYSLGPQTPHFAFLGLSFPNCKMRCLGHNEFKIPTNLDIPPKSSGIALNINANPYPRPLADIGVCLLTNKSDFLHDVA